jgi:hypothetical protein
VSTRSLENSTFGIDAAHQTAPGFDEGFSTFLLKPVRQYVDVNPSRSNFVLFRVRRFRCANVPQGMGGGLTV